MIAPRGTFYADRIRPAVILAADLCGVHPLAIVGAGKTIELVEETRNALAVAVTNATDLSLPRRANACRVSQSTFIKRLRVGRRQAASDPDFSATVKRLEAAIAEAAA